VRLGRILDDIRFRVYDLSMIIIFAYVFACSLEQIAEGLDRIEK
jgi:hypothetical protein